MLGMDSSRAKELSQAPKTEHASLMRFQKMDPIWAYQYIVQYYPGTMWQK